MKSHNLDLTLTFLFVVLFLLGTSFNTAYSVDPDIDPGGSPLIAPEDAASPSLPAGPQVQEAIPTAPTDATSQSPTYTAQPQGVTPQAVIPTIPNLPSNAGPQVQPNAGPNFIPSIAPNIAPYANAPDVEAPSTQEEADTIRAAPPVFVESADLETEGAAETQDTTIESADVIEVAPSTTDTEAASLEEHQPTTKLPDSASFQAQARVAAVIHSTCNNGNCTGCSTVPFNSRGHTAQSLCCTRNSNRPGCN